MHHELIQKLWEIFPPEDKGDFYGVYLYLKHVDHFIFHGIKSMGIEGKKGPDNEVSEETDDILRYMIQRVAETAGSRETSVYHAKVMQLKEALQFVIQKKDISLEAPETVIPFKQARSIILQNPTSISIGECACRSVADNPCLPPGEMDVCMFIGDPTAAFIAEFNPKFRQITQDEAVKILEDCHNRGFVHCAYFKRDVARRFVAICNCCSCCCLGMKAWNMYGEQLVPILAPSGYVSEIGNDCNGCGDCVTACGFSAISLDDDKQIAVVDIQKCMGCGVCEYKCPAGAISLRLEPSKGEPLNLEELLIKT